MADTIILSSKIKDYAADIDKLTLSLDGLEKESKDYQNVVNEIKNKQELLNNILSDSTETTEKVNEATVSLKALFKELLKLMQLMLAEGISPTDEAFVEIAKKAGDMKDAMADASAVIRHYADDTRGLSTVVDIAKTGAAVYGTYTGVLTTFGILSESVNKSLQTLMGITTTLNSLQQIQTALVDRASITYRAYQGAVSLLTAAKIKLGLSTTEETAATVAHTGAMVADTAATGAATVATNLFKKALMSTGIGLVVVAIGTLVANLGDLWDTIKEGINWIGKITNLWHLETEEEKKVREESYKVADAIIKVKTDTDKQRQSLEKTVNEWKNAKNEYAKTLALENAKTAMNNLGIACDSTSNAEKILQKHLPEVNRLMEILGEVAEKTAVKELLFTKTVNDAIELFKNDNLELTDESINKIIAIANLKVKGLTNQINVLNDEANKIKANIAKDVPKTGGTKAKSTSTVKQTIEVDTSGAMKELDRSLKELQDRINYLYNLISAKGEATINDEIEKITSLYIATTDIILKEIEDRNKLLENTKITEQQRLKIKDEIYELEQKFEATKREYIINNEKLIVEAKKKALEEINKNTKKALEDEKKTYEDNNIADFYVDLLRDTEPEVAALLLQTFGISDELKEQIINDLDLINSDNLDKQREYWLQQEEEEYQHQQNLLQIQKDALVEIGIVYGEDSELYLTKKLEIFDREEKMTKEHVKRLAKIEKEHNKSSEDENKATLKDYVALGHGIGDVFGTVANIMEQDIRTKEENGEITEELAKKLFETVKTMQIAAATINTISGAIGAFTQAYENYPPPVGPILGGINAALVTATGIAQIAQIKSTQWGGSGSTAAGGVTPGQREVSNIDFSGVLVNPLLDETADLNRMTTLSEQQPTTQLVVILQSDIEDSMNQVLIRESSTKF